MASKRKLKKSIRLICGELFADCVALRMCAQADKEKIDSLMAKVLEVHGDYVARISHSEKAREKFFFKNLRESFTKEINELSDSIIQA